jgi:hypothetical protein
MSFSFHHTVGFLSPVLQNGVGLRIDERFASLIREIDRVAGNLSSISLVGIPGAEGSRYRAVPGKSSR